MGNILNVNWEKFDQKHFRCRVVQHAAFLELWEYALAARRAPIQKSSRTCATCCAATPPSPQPLKWRHPLTLVGALPVWLIDLE